MDQTKFVKIVDKIYDYNHANGKVSRIDLNKEWCSCTKMFENGLCSHLVKIAVQEDYQLPGMAPKSKSLHVRRRMQTKNYDLELSESDDELNEQLEALEFIETQFEPIAVETIVENNKSLFAIESNKENCCG